MSSSNQTCISNDGVTWKCLPSSQAQILSRIKVSVHLENPRSEGKYKSNSMQSFISKAETPFTGNWNYIPVSGRGQHFAIKLEDLRREEAPQGRSYGAKLYVDGQHVKSITMCPCCTGHAFIPGHRSAHKLWKFSFGVTDFSANNGAIQSQLALLQNSGESKSNGDDESTATADLKLQAILKRKLQDAGCIRVKIYEMSYSGRGNANKSATLPPGEVVLPEGDATRKIKVSTQYEASAVRKGSVLDQATKWMYTSENIVTGLWHYDKNVASVAFRYREATILSKRGVMKGGKGKRKASDMSSSSSSSSSSQKKSKVVEVEEEIVAWDGTKKTVTMIDLTD